MSKDKRRNSRQVDYDEENNYKGERTPALPRGSALYMAEDLIPTFTGQDKTFPVSRWIQEIEDNAEVFGWTPVQQLLMARRALSGTAALWLRAERVLKTWDELKQGLTKEFPDTVDSKTIHEMMSARKKKNNETCLDYMLIMKEMGRRGKMADYVAIKYIIDGICDLESNKIMLYGVTTYQELKEKLKIYETVSEKIRKQKMVKREFVSHTTTSTKSSTTHANSGTIISVLTKLCLENPALWYRHLSRLQRSLNSTFQRSIACTPFELMVGVKMRRKEDLQIYELLQQEERDNYMESREELRQSAKRQIQQLQEENMKNYNRRRKESSKYKENNWVAIKRTQFGSGLKLKPKFLGPYRVTKVKRNDRYNVEKIDPTTEGPNRTSSAADHMKGWPTDN